MRVLLADPDDILVETVQSFLWDRGHEAEIATDALECITILREFAPQVLVIDRELLWGGCDGVLWQMSQERSLSEMPVILTGDGDIHEGVADLPTRPAGFLAKPYGLGELLSHIHAVGRRALSPISPYEDA